MRIALLIRSLAVSGAERQLVNTAIALKEGGHDVEVITFYANGALVPELERAGVSHHSLNKQRRWDLGTLYGSLRRRLRETRPQIVYAFGTIANFLASGVGRVDGVQRIVWGIRTTTSDLSGYDWTTTLASLAEERLWWVPDLVITNSSRARLRLLSRGYAPSKVVVVHNGIDVSTYRPDRVAREATRNALGVPAGATLVGMVTRWDPIKGIEIALEAFALLAARNADYRFLWAGLSLEGARELQRLVDEKGIGERATILGRRDDLAALYNAMDIHVLTSRTEGFPNVVAEAMACGTPVVTTPVGAAPEIVSPFGAVAPEFAGASVATAISDLASRLAAHPPSREAISESIRARYSLNELGSKTAAALLECLSSG